MVAWIGLIAILLLGGVLLWAALSVRRGLVLNDRGILDRRLGLGWIPWEEVEGAYAPTPEDGEIVRLRLRRTSRLARILRRRTARGTPGPVGGALEVDLHLAGTDRTPLEVLQEILSRTGTRDARADIHRPLATGAR